MREETGFDIRPLLVEQDCIEMHIGQQRSKLFIITGVRSPLKRGIMLPASVSCFHTNKICAVARTVSSSTVRQV